ncbi:NAC domain containing protein 28 [Zea mays]|uniref:NAC domain containing protein 28 n=1 Tax=Zea mays TaxID=4577 RepID=A0A1D6JLP9_MAIZE|nr:NAC domain containing protein 28 [Zea mays]
MPSQLNTKTLSTRETYIQSFVSEPYYPYRIASSFGARLLKCFACRLQIEATHLTLAGFRRGHSRSDPNTTSKVVRMIPWHISIFAPRSSFTKN